MRIAASGTSQRLDKALKWFFQLCPQSDEPPDLTIECSGVPAKKLIDFIPAWAQEHIPKVIDGEMPLLVMGPFGEMATVGLFEGLYSYSSGNARLDEISIFVGIAESGETCSIIPSLLLPILREALLTRNQLLFHAAAVQVPGEVGVMMVAPSGGGKTTTTLSMIRNGAQCIADDLVVLDSSGSNPRAFGIPKLLNIRQRTLDFFKEIPLGSAGEYRLPERISARAETIYGSNCSTTHSDLHIIFFLELTEGQISIEPLSLESAMQRLVLGHTFSSTQISQGQSILSICDILSAVRTFLVQTGDNPHLLGKHLMAFCSEQAGSAHGKQP